VLGRRKGFEPLTPRFEVCTMLLILLTSVRNAAHAAFTIRCFPPPAVTGNRYGTSELNRDGVKNSGAPCSLNRPSMPRSTRSRRPTGAPNCVVLDNSYFPLSQN